MLWMLLWWAGWTAAAATDRPDVILITLDTTRADALSCYGQPPDISRALAPVTPHLDALASKGARFEAMFAHAPTTLASHASMLTGLDPHGHGVPFNGVPLSASVPTLAEVFQGAGYRTVAVIGSSALAREMGLDRGFWVYDERLDYQAGQQYEARAEAVVDRALEQLAGVPAEQPTLLWVHFFDAHAPYAAPGAFGERFVDPDYRGRFHDAPLEPRTLLGAPEAGRAKDVDYVAARYLGEVAYVDRQIGRLLAGLDAAGRLENAVVAVVADHGETLSEDPRHGWSHGFDVPDEVMRVPFIVRGYGLATLTPRVVQRQAGLKMVGPTLLWLAGLPTGLGDGWHLGPALRAGPVRDGGGWPERPVWPVFMEATRGPVEGGGTGWPNLGRPRRALVGGAAVRRGIIGQEGIELTTGPRLLAPLLVSQLRSWDQDSPDGPSREIPLATQRALEALGYSRP